MHEPRRYQLVRNIASGGMAQVYEAKLIGASGFERRVAVKRVLPQHSHNPSVQRMFLDEARVVSQLHHGNIIQVIDYGVVEDCEFIAMEYVDGVDAGRALDRAHTIGAPLPEGVALHVIAEAAHALDYAHNCRDEQQLPLHIVHRDVNPQNILLSWQGDVKLGDFGIALSRNRSELTRTGVIKGKDRFMSPEQAEGVRNLSPAVDVYALGVTLQVLILRVGGPPIASFAVSPELGPQVRKLVRECTDPQPGNRPTAREVADRAGRLAAEGLGRDGRSALVEWMQPLRGFFDRPSKLDDLMGLSLVAVAPHHFTVSREADRPDAAASALDRSERQTTPLVEPSALDREDRPTTPFLGPALATADSREADGIDAEASALDRSERQTAPPKRPVRSATATKRQRQVLALLVGSGLVGLVGGALALWPSDWPTTSTTRPQARHRSPDAHAIQAVALDSGAQHVGDALGVAGAAGSRDAAPPAAAAVARDATVALRRHRVLRPARATRRRGPTAGAKGRRHAEHRRHDGGAPGGKLAGASIFGWIRIGGAALVGGEVRVDGTVVGYAPLEQQLLVGARRVTVRAPNSDHLLLDRTVVVTLHNTRRNAVRLIR